MVPPIFWLFVTLLCNFTFAQQDATCSALKECKSGCCSSSGNCGFGPDFCGTGCQGTCNAKAECGQYAIEENFACPLSVCCSQWGFCGTTAEFCNSKCQNEGGCLPVLRPSCAASENAMDSEVRIGYYGTWGAGRSCDSMQPENIAAGVLTHINVAFEYVSGNFEITDDSGPIVARVSRLKKKYPGLRVNIAIGGWVFNDPPTQYRFSEMASTRPNRDKFVASLIIYIQKYALNGVDIDWEYPVADDRGGVKADYNNLVQLCSEIKTAFDRVDPGWELTITLPSSYWYLRGFNIEILQKDVDWFNIMSYDIHGLWDQKSVWTGPFLKGHTNLTEIDEGLDLLWRNGILPEKVVMGYGFYGRSFTMTDTTCSTPPSCTFTGPGFAGDCTNEPGILSYSEVVSKIGELGSDVSYDEASSVKWMVYSSNQWISYDDEESFTAKKKFQSSRCLKGLMIWSLDLDTSDYEAMTGLMGQDAMQDALTDTGLDPGEKAQLTSDLAAYTGQDCYVTQRCTDGLNSNKGPGQVCMPGYSAVETGHAPLQMQVKTQSIPCKEGQWHEICCPTKAMPKNCEWIGAPIRSAFGCDRGCGSTQFELTTDTFTNFKGTGQCYSGARSLCCDATPILQKCHWTSDCDYSPDMEFLCGADETGVARRVDKDNGEMCQKASWGGAVLVSSRQSWRSYCCPNSDVFENCKWSNDQTRDSGNIARCVTKQCPKTELSVTAAQIPWTTYDLTYTNSDVCLNYVNYPGSIPDFHLCCDPPSRLTKEWPVLPKYLWSDDRADDDTAEVTWEWSNNFGNSDKDTTPDDLEEDHGEDPYGFVMLDGPPGSIHKQFDQDFTVLQRDEPLNIKPRSLLTTNQTLLEGVFEHSQETIRVYCNHAHDSLKCRRIFHEGAKDTIIKLPHHVGEGPWARIVSMEPETVPEFPPWIIRKRETTSNLNGVYVLTFDYNFHLIKRADGEPVSMRIDYTNLAGYWDDITDEPASKAKRSTDEHLSFHDWKARVQRAKKLDNSTLVEVRGDGVAFSPNADSAPLGSDLQSRDLERRWWGSFVNWIKKLSSVKITENGVLPMGFTKLFTLYSGRLTCTSDSGVSITAGLDITADMQVQMRTQYSYYFSGTIAPPTVIDAFAYVGAHPRITAGITLTGDAALKYQSDTKKLIDTITYPGLAIKGIAAVGPTLDLWGRIDGEVTVSGRLRVGASYTFPPIEMYMPNDDETHDRATKDLEDHKSDGEGLAPEFAAEVKATVDFNVRVTPEINLGIKVGGGIGSFKGTLVDAHVATFVNTTINFNAHATAATVNNANSWEYGYGVKFLYRIGLTAVAELYLYGQWKTKNYYPVDWQTINIYGPITVKSGSSLNRRALGWLPSEDILADPLFSIPRSEFIPESGSYSMELVDYSGNISSPLVSRQDSGQALGSNEFKWGDFTCNTGGGACSSESVETDTGNTRRNIKMGSVGSANQLVKRATGDCKKKLPIMYYNCESVFADITFTPDTGGNGVSVVIPGICTSVGKFLQNWRNIGGRGSIKPRGTATSWILTWDSGRQGPRRSRSCPTGFCSSDNTAKKGIVFGIPNTGKPSLTNCDEFPFASAEEGGPGYYELHPQDPLGTTRTCVPSFQNDMQGQCNALINNINTNVNYFNDAKTPTADNPDVQGWGRGVNGWVTKDGFGKKNRLTEYKTQQPQSAGLTAADRENNLLGWYHKRNFTLQLAYPDPADNPEDAFPSGKVGTGTINDPADSKKPKPVTHTLGSAAWIICAINTQSQARYTIDGANGWCWDGISRRAALNGHTTILSYWQCNVNFSPPAGALKRDVQPIGYLAGAPIYSVERVEGTKNITYEVED